MVVVKLLVICIISRWAFTADLDGRYLALREPYAVEWDKIVGIQLSYVYVLSHACEDRPRGVEEK